MLPPVLTIYITNYCSLNCSHCFFTISNGLNKTHMLFSQIIKILDDARKNNVFLISIAGGDPLLHPNIFEIIDEIELRGMASLLALTGLNISKDVARKLKEKNIASIQLSLDGSNETINSKYRGIHSFEMVIKSIDNLQTAGNKVNLAFCLDTNNYLDLPEMLNLASKLHIYKLKIQFWTKSIYSGNYHKELNEEQKEIVKNIIKQYNIKRGSLVAILNEIEPNDKYAPILITADGYIKTDEFSDNIGHINSSLLSETYKNFLRGG